MTINHYSDKNLRPNRQDGLRHYDKLWKGICYGQAWLPNQIACSTGKTSPQDCQKGPCTIFSQQVSARLYPATAIRYPDLATVLWDRLPRYCATATGFHRPQEHIRAYQVTTFHNAPESPAASGKKRAFDIILTEIFSDASTCGLIERLPDASIDSTGLENHFVSRHFIMRQGKRTSRYRKWTKLTIVCHNKSHLIAAAVVSSGPSADCPYLPPAVRCAVKHLAIACLTGDAGYDCEDNHILCREQLGIGSTVIPVNERNRRTGKLTGRYRRQMKNRFPKRNFNQRWQVESVVSRMKRRLGYALRARTDESRMAECLVRVLTYNLMLLYLLFQRAYRIAI